MFEALLRRPAVVHLLQCFTCQADASFGCLAQQCYSHGRVARAAFTMKQHHRQVVLAERMAALRGSPEMLPRLDMVAHEPRRPGLQDVQIQVWQGQWLGWVDLGAGGTRASDEQAAEQMAHDRTLRRW